MTNEIRIMSSWCRSLALKDRDPLRAIYRLACACAFPIGPKKGPIAPTKVNRSGQIGPRDRLGPSRGISDIPTPAYTWITGNYRLVYMVNYSKWALNWGDWPINWALFWALFSIGIEWETEEVKGGPILVWRGLGGNRGLVLRPHSNSLKLIFGM